MKGIRVLRYVGNRQEPENKLYDLPEYVFAPSVPPVIFKTLEQLISDAEKKTGVQ